MVYVFSKKCFYKAHTTVTVTHSPTPGRPGPNTRIKSHTRHRHIPSRRPPCPPAHAKHKPSTCIHRPHCSLSLVLCSHHSLSLLFGMVTVFCRVTRTTPSLSNTANASSAHSQPHTRILHTRLRNSSNRTV